MGQEGVDYAMSSVVGYSNGGKITVRVGENDIERGYLLVDYMDGGEFRQVVLSSRVRVGDSWVCWKPRPGCFR